MDETSSIVGLGVRSVFSRCPYLVRDSFPIGTTCRNPLTADNTRSTGGAERDNRQMPSPIVWEGENAANRGTAVNLTLVSLRTATDSSHGVERGVERLARQTTVFGGGCRDR